MTDTELKQRIEAKVEELRDRIVDGLSRILQFNTVSGSPDPSAQNLYRSETQRCLQWLEGECLSSGFAWRNYDNQLAVADLDPAGEGDDFIALPVHIDVVPPGEGWTHPAFSGAVVDGVIYGRGCQDDKGPVIQMLYAMNILRDLDLPLRRGVKLVVGTCEECGDWSDIKRYKELEPVPSFSIVPDASFPIINGEKGMMNLRIRARLLGDEEPAVGGFRFESARSGDRANIVPPKALLTFAGDAYSDPGQLERELARFIDKQSEVRAEIQRGPSNTWKITFHGKGAHGSTPQDGHSAALDMLLFMTQSGFVSDDEADLATFLHDAGSDPFGGKIGIDVRHEFIGPTTVNLGILNWSVGDAQAVLNIRNTMGLTGADAISRVSAAIQEFSDETGFEIEAHTDGKTMEPVYVDPADHPEFIGALKSSYTAYTGREATLHAIGGTTYAKEFPNAVCFGPVDPAEEEELAHQTDERISVEHLLRNVKIYAHALVLLCTDEGSPAGA